MALLTTDEIQRALAGMPGWEHVQDTIVRHYTLDGGFTGAIAFVNRLADAANAADHHPDLSISWNRVTVTLSTHSEGGITHRDIALASDADRLAATP